MLNHASPSHLFQTKKILFVVLSLNLGVSVLKGGWGYWTGFISMQADGLHSFLDAGSTVVGLVGVWIASHPPDDTHPYGHRKFETIASFCIAFFLFIGCYEILKGSYGRFRDGATTEVNLGSFVIMFVSLGTNYFVAQWEQKEGIHLKSEVLVADAGHTRSDIWADISVIIGLVAFQIGFPIFDPIAAIVIVGIIGKAGVHIFMESSKVLTDYSRIDPKEIEVLALGIEGIHACHAIRTRGSLNHVYVDLHIHVPAEMSLEKAHCLSHRVESEIIKKFPDVLEVVIHLEPHLPHLEHD